MPRGIYKRGRKKVVLTKNGKKRGRPFRNPALNPIPPAPVSVEAATVEEAIRIARSAVRDATQAQIDILNDGAAYLRDEANKLEQAALSLR